jgi:hypothetical protein
MYPQVWGLIGVGIKIVGSMSGILLTSRLTRSCNGHNGSQTIKRQSIAIAEQSGSGRETDS